MAPWHHDRRIYAYKTIQIQTLVQPLLAELGLELLMVANDFKSPKKAFQNNLSTCYCLYMAHFPHAAM